MIHKRKIDKLDFIKSKNFQPSKVIVQRMKRQAINWMKILAKHITDKRCQGCINKS